MKKFKIFEVADLSKFNKTDDLDKLCQEIDKIAEKQDETGDPDLGLIEIKQIKSKEPKSEERKI
jgi:hypothetical protein